MRLKDVGILWDLDGTVIDSKECHYLTWRDTFRKFGFDLDHSLFDTQFGRNNQATIPIYLGFEPDEELAESLAEEKERLFRQLAPQQTTLIPGVKDWLRQAKVRHVPQAIASSASQENINVVIASFGLSPFFDALISGEFLPAKPKPDVFLQAASALNRHPKYCLVIEDSLSGIQAAKNAGMRCVAVSTSHPQAKLTQADLVIDDFTFPFEEMLKQLNIV